MGRLFLSKRYFDVRKTGGQVLKLQNTEADEVLLLSVRSTFSLLSDAAVLGSKKPRQGPASSKGMLNRKQENFCQYYNVQKLESFKTLVAENIGIFHLSIFAGSFFRRLQSCVKVSEQNSILISVFSCSGLSLNGQIGCFLSIKHPEYAFCLFLDVFYTKNSLFQLVLYFYKQMRNAFL